MRALGAPFPGSKPQALPLHFPDVRVPISLLSALWSVCMLETAMSSLLQHRVIQRQCINSPPHPPSAQRPQLITAASPVTFWTAGWLPPPCLSRHTLPTAQGSCAPGSSHHHRPTLAFWTSAPSPDTSTQTTHKESLKLHSWLLFLGWPSFSGQP